MISVCYLHKLIQFDSAENWTQNCFKTIGNLRVMRIGAVYVLDAENLFPTPGGYQDFILKLDIQSTK